MYNSFISVVTVLQYPHQVRELSSFLNDIHQVLEQNFTDYETILINNTQHTDIDNYITPLKENIKKQIYLINLSTPTDINHAILAGLDRSNGDYTVILEFAFNKQTNLILDLFEAARTPFDIVYLRESNRKVPGRFKLPYALFYYIFKKYSKIKIDPNACNSRIISRRALNSVLKLRENLKYMKPIYSIVGYSTSHIDIKGGIGWDSELGFSERFKNSLVAITSFTTFLRSLLLWIFIFSLIFLFGVVLNALSVRFYQSDLLGNPAVAESGWTFLVVMLSIFFAITCLNLYIMSIYLSNIYQEIKGRPLYIIESVKRF